MKLRDFAKKCNELNLKSYGDNNGARGTLYKHESKEYYIANVREWVHNEYPSFKVQPSKWKIVPEIEKYFKDEKSLEVFRKNVANANKVKDFEVRFIPTKKLGFYDVKGSEMYGGFHSADLYDEDGTKYRLEVSFRCVGRKSEVNDKNANTIMFAIFAEYCKKNPGKEIYIDGRGGQEMIEDRFNELIVDVDVDFKLTKVESLSFEQLKKNIIWMMGNAKYDGKDSPLNFFKKGKYGDKIDEDEFEAAYAKDKKDAEEAWGDGVAASYRKHHGFE